MFWTGVFDNNFGILSFPPIVNHTYFASGLLLTAYFKSSFFKAHPAAVVPPIATLSTVNPCFIITSAKDFLPYVPQLSPKTTISADYTKGEIIRFMAINSCKYFICKSVENLCNLIINNNLIFWKLFLNKKINFQNN